MDRACAIAFVTLWGSVATLADTSPEIGQLLREPASMLDVGLYRLRDSLNTFVTKAFRPSNSGIMPAVTVRTSYDTKHDQIHILLVVPMPPPFLRRSKPRETCGQLVELVQRWMESERGWTDLFTHAGYTANEKKDAALMEQLPRLVVIEARVDAAVSATNEHIVLSCSGTLSSPVISYTYPPPAAP